MSGIYESLISAYRERIKDPLIRAGSNYFFFNKEYGEMVSFKMDPDSKIIEASFDLKGESDTLTIALKEYEIIKRGDKSYIKIGAFEASREWIDALLNNFVKDEEFELPDAVAAALGVLA